MFYPGARHGFQKKAPDSTEKSSKRAFSNTNPTDTETSFYKIKISHYFQCLHFYLILYIFKNPSAINLAFHCYNTRSKDYVTIGYHRLTKTSKAIVLYY